MTVTATHAHAGLRGAGLIAACLLLVGGCSETGAPGFLAPKEEAAAEEPAPGADSVKLVERDVEAPEVFEVTDMGLWDGRPSLGGVWVAHPEVDEPERVIIRNMKNSKFVIGALFRRERENPGPVIQVSSDAAEALGMLAGQPAQLNVTALRREEAPAAGETAAAEGAPPVAAPDDIEEAALEPVEGAEAAIEAAEGTGQAADESAPAAPAAAELDKPYIQIGIFSVEQNARNTATAMRREGMVPTVKKQSARGKTFWRVIVGPATSKSERAVLLDKIKEVGFDDAYFVSE